MIQAGRLLWAGLVCACIIHGSAEAQPLLTAEQQGCLTKARRFERAGWIYLHIEGEPRERGFQHGYLLAKEINDGLVATRASWEQDSAMDWSWLVKRAADMFVPKIDPENLAELEGISEGARAAGTNVSRDELIAYNAILELQGYW